MWFQLCNPIFFLALYFSPINGNNFLRLSGISKFWNSNNDKDDSKTTEMLCIRGGANDKDNKVKGHCIGIDLGTTYSCVAVWKNGRVEICPNEQGNRITPSQVAWTSDGQRLVGDAAKNQASSNPTNTVFDVKRLIGRKFTDPTVQRDAKLFPFKRK